MKTDSHALHRQGETVLMARGLGRDFAGFTAVNDVDLDVAHARIHALIGPNG
ncbi:ABC transporter ATP-binding protein, partial [Paracoccus sp. P2]